MEARRERVHELTLAGKSKRAIAAELGVDQSTVARDLKARLEAVRMKAEVNQMQQMARAKKLPGFQRPLAPEGHGTPGGAWDAAGVQGCSEDDGKEVEAAGSGRAGAHGGERAGRGADRETGR